jgi:hypothetical protein
LVHFGSKKLSQWIPKMMWNFNQKLFYNKHFFTVLFLAHSK